MAEYFLDSIAQTRRKRGNVALARGLTYSIYRWLWAGVDWLYPPICGGCGVTGTRWCAACERETEVIQPPTCPICGRSQDRNKICVSCRNNPPSYTAVRSWAIFGGAIRNAIHRLKYERDLGLGEMMARPLIKLLNSLDWSIDLVVPVPIGLARLAERGYNQAALLARPVAYALDIPYHSRALVKVKDTPSQVGLNLVERQANVRDAFFAKPGAVAGKSVLIIDDVTTSGSTINECAAVLLQAGSSKVYGLTLAHAAWTDDSGINQEDALSILEGIGSNT